MSVHLAQVTFESVTALAKDRYVNTFHFNFNDWPVQPGNFTNIVDLLTDFYNVPVDTNPAVGTYLSTVIGPAPRTPTLTIYSLAETPPRAPVFETTFPIPNSGDAPLPTEVATCVSFSAARVSGQAQARRRGRIFLGPLSRATLAATGSQLEQSMPNPAFLTAVQASAGRLVDAAAASVSWDLVTYSRANDPGGTGTTGFSVVTHGWVDNAWDTQRRRGVSATSRRTFGTA